MALPMAQALLGAPGVFYCSACLIPFNVVCFTHGVAVMSGGRHFNWKKLLFNPGTISVAIGLPLYLLEVKLPVVLADPISFIAGLNTPMAMIMFGTYLANTDLKTMFREKKIYLAAALKLLVLPALMLLIFRLCGVTGALLTSCIISASAPTANNTVMFAAKYGRDTGLSSKVVAVITFLSILTMPLMIALSQTI
ncbi:MAG: AEC family transporter [Acutalibacteraceae bacterium]